MPSLDSASSPQSVHGVPERIGPYRVVGRLGRGGQGVVYRALDGEGGTVAVKVLHLDWARDARLRHRFAREVEAARRVASFCTAGILDAQLLADPPYIVSEYVPGPSLRQEIVQRGARLPGDLYRLAIGTVTALAAIHRAGVVHRDFKPDNVLLGPDGPRVIDFGVAHTGTGAALTEGEAIGTPAYMAPEQADAGQIGPAADMFSWAEVMVFAATGSPPFGDDTPMAVVMRMLTEEPDLTALDEPLRGICERCLNRDPQLRPSARDVLLRLLDDTPADDQDAVLNAGARAASPATGAAAAGAASSAAVGSAGITTGDGPDTAPGAAGPTEVGTAGGLRARTVLPVAAAVAVAGCAGMLAWHRYGAGEAGQQGRRSPAGQTVRPTPPAGTWRGVAGGSGGPVRALGVHLKPGGRGGEVTDALRHCTTGLRHGRGDRYTLVRVGSMAGCLPGRRVTIVRQSGGTIGFTWSVGRLVLHRVPGAVTVPQRFAGSWAGRERPSGVRVRVILPRGGGRPTWHAAALDCAAGLSPWAVSGDKADLILRTTAQCGGSELVELTMRDQRLDYLSRFSTGGMIQRAVLTRG